ncbi:MAG TPA: glycoside hydrolase family 1 protein, partial [Opitutaceae bacterium]|nr:glycoside hydrolase family 1 protein [Opitutaceae bacterium]
RGIVETCHALRSVDPEILIAHVDATDLYHSADPTLASEVERRQEIVFLALDLVSGRIDSEHALYAWLRQKGMADSDLEWFRARALELPLIGINLYPMFTSKLGGRTPAGGVRWKMPYAGAELIEQLGAMYWERYRAPVFISETASVGSLRRRRLWLEDSLAAVRRLRERGVPLVGYTWWPLFALVTWAYRQGTHPPEYYLKQMGLWDLDARLQRVRTPLVDQFRALAEGGSATVGQLVGAGVHA